MKNLTDFKLLSELRRLMCYDPDTGMFTRIINSSARARAGSIAGNLGPRGYWHICVLSKTYLAHRLVWLYVYGIFPPLHIDHKNRIRHDNKLINLRLASSKQNSENQSLSLANTSGAKGVTWRADTCNWQAQIQHNKKYIYLGCFSTVAEAKNAYQQAATKLFTHYLGI